MREESKKRIQNLGYSTYQSLIERFLRELRRRLGDDNLLACALFGSVARSEGRPESDIDLLLLHAELNDAIKRKKIRLLVEADDWAEKRSLWDLGIFAHLSIVSRTVRELGENPLILLDVMDHGVLLYDPKGFLKRMLERLKVRLKELGARKMVLDNGTWYWDLKPDWKSGEIVEIKI